MWVWVWNIWCYKYIYVLEIWIKFNLFSYECSIICFWMGIKFDNYVYGGIEIGDIIYCLVLLIFLIK